MKNIWHLAHEKRIRFAEKSVIMGILNITPDSFSDGGSCHSVEDAVPAANRMIAEGAMIIDVGGESTRPGADSVDAKTEQARVLPVIQALSGISDILISVDTYRADTARLAIEAGAHIINDVWGMQKDPDIGLVAAQTGAGVIIMHTGREREREPDVISDQQIFFSRSLEIAVKAGVQREQIVLDPGFGFAKTVEENVMLMHRARELHQFGFPLLAGTSRKRFLGIIAKQEDARSRDIATGATSVIMRMAGFDIFRVHNVAINRDVLAVADIVRGQSLCQ